MELAKPKLLDRVLIVCREQNVLPALAQRYRRCVYDYLLFLKAESGHFVSPDSVGRDKVEAYLNDLARRGLSVELQLLAFEVMRFLYERLLDKNIVCDYRQLLLKRFADKIAELHYSPKTEQTYGTWCVDFLNFVGVMPWHSQLRTALSTQVVEDWLTSLATERHVTANTQNLALQAILFLAKRVCGIDISGVDALRAKRPQTLPDVLSCEQVAAVLKELTGDKKVQAMLGYGCGMRVSEAISLRVKDCLFDRKQIIIRDAKGRVDRVVALPDTLSPLLRRQIEEARKWHLEDAQRGLARVPLPGAFDVKSPTAESSWEWFWVFPSHVRSQCPKTKRIGRFHVDESGINRTLKHIGHKLGIPQRLHFHILRHCNATHMLDAGANIRRVQTHLGHKNLQTTMRYTHVALTGVSSERSPLDSLLIT